MNGPRTDIVWALAVLTACGSKSDLGEVVNLESDASNVIDAASRDVEPDASTCSAARSAPRLIASQLVGSNYGARQIASDGAFVFVPNAQKGVLRIPRCGGEPVLVTGVAPSDTRTLTLFKQRAYFSLSSGVRSIGEDGSSPRDVTIAPTPFPGRLATDESYVYFSANQGLGPFFRALQGGSTTELISDLTGEIAVDEAWVYGRQIKSTNTIVAKAPKSGGTLIVPLTPAFPTSPMASLSITLDATYVYFAAADGVHRVDKSGVGHTLLAPLTHVLDMVVDGNELVTGSGNANGVVNRISVDGSTNEQLFAGAFPIDAVVADSQSTYWLDANGDLYRLDKP